MENLHQIEEKVEASSLAVVEPAAYAAIVQKEEFKRSPNRCKNPS